MARIPYRTSKSSAYQGTHRFFQTHPGRVAMVLILVAFLFLANYFINSVWTWLILIVVVAIIGWIQRIIYGPDAEFDESQRQRSNLSKRLRKEKPVEG